MQVNWSDHVEAEEDSGDGGWDHHYRNFQIMQDRHGPGWIRRFRRCWRTLSDRGLLESTLVVAMGEFGRTPKVNDKAGRDHWEHCYSALFAGGGVRSGGRVVGASDGRGERPIDRPARPPTWPPRPPRGRHDQRTDAAPLASSWTARRLRSCFSEELSTTQRRNKRSSIVTAHRWSCPLCRFSFVSFVSLW